MDATHRSWPGPIRIVIHAGLAAGLAAVLTGLGFWVTRTDQGVVWRSLPAIRDALRIEYGSEGGPLRFAADTLCAFPWILAALARARRLGSWPPTAVGLPLILSLTGLTIFFNLFGQAVRTQGGLDEDSLRRVLAYAVAFLPPYLAFVPLLVCLGRLKGGGWTALVLVLPLYVGARLALPELYQHAVYSTADGRLLIWPPDREARIAVFTPMLGLWGIFALLEWRIAWAARRDRETTG